MQHAATIAGIPTCCPIITTRWNACNYYVLHATIARKITPLGMKTAAEGVVAKRVSIQIYLLTPMDRAMLPYTQNRPYRAARRV